MSKDPNWVPPWEDLPTEAGRQSATLRMPDQKFPGVVVYLVEEEEGWRCPDPVPCAFVFASWAVTPARYQGCENTFICEDGQNMEQTYARAREYLEKCYKFRREFEAQQKKG